MRRWHGVCLAGLVVLLAGCSKEPPKAPPPPLVETFTVGGGSVADRQAVAEPKTDPSLVLSQSAGRVEAILVRPGQAVAAGQALVRLDPADGRLADSSARVQISAATAQLASAEADFARYQKLRDQNFISQAEFERRQAAILASRAEFEARLDGLGILTSRALVAGVVSTLQVQPGQLVAAGQPLLRLAVKSAAGTAAGSVRASSTQGQSGLRLPLTALIDGQAVMRVVAANGQNLVRRQPVRVSSTDEQWATLAEGLEPGSVVVAIGAHLLTDGQPVRTAGQAAVAAQPAPAKP